MSQLEILDDDRVCVVVPPKEGITPAQLNVRALHCAKKGYAVSVEARKRLMRPLVIVVTFSGASVRELVSELRHPKPKRSAKKSNSGPPSPLAFGPPLPGALTPVAPSKSDVVLKLAWWVCGHNEVGS